MFFLFFLINDCDNLTGIEVDEESVSFVSLDGVLYSLDNKDEE